MNQDFQNIGEVYFRGKVQPFGIYTQDRLRHMYILGKTGVGKSTFLLHLIAQDLHAGRGIALFDPHGSLALDVLGNVPSWRIQDVVYINPQDKNYALSFNIFRLGKELNPNRSLLASNIISIFKKNWGEFWGPRLEYILRNGLLAISEFQDASLFNLYRFFLDESFRKKKVAQIKDPIIKYFWTEEFTSYSPKLRAEALSPVLNKLGGFLSSPIMRNIFAQERNRIDIQQIFEKSQIVIANLSTGKIGEDNTRLFGSLLFSAFALEISSRASPNPPFFIYADEFQYFVTDSIATILSESRKYGLGLVLAHQYLYQLPQSLQSAVFGNVGSKIIFRLGHEDAEILAPAFTPTFGKQDLQSIPKYEAFVSLLANGKELSPFRAKMLNVFGSNPTSSASKIIEESRKKYCIPSSTIDGYIRSFFP